MPYSTTNQLRRKEKDGFFSFKNDCVSELGKELRTELGIELGNELENKLWIVS